MLKMNDANMKMKKTLRRYKKILSNKMEQIPKINIGKKIERSNIHRNHLNSALEAHFDAPIILFQVKIHPFCYASLYLSYVCFQCMNSNK